MWETHLIILIYREEKSWEASQEEEEQQREEEKRGLGRRLRKIYFSLFISLIRRSLGKKIRTP